MLNEMAEKGLLPDTLIRVGIEALLRKRLRHEARGTRGDRKLRFSRWIEQMQASPVAMSTDSANEQHYEVPAAFFEKVLGRHLKYSACFWPEGVQALNDAEVAMLDLTSRRANLKDGQQILELGCGWGALSIWMAEHYPNSSVMAVSNSNSQREFIRAKCLQKGLDNLTVVTADMNNFSVDRRFDRVVSVEMFEHMRNWHVLLSRIHDWLVPDGLLFLHIFTHRHYAYPFEAQGADNWMGRHFFTGGMMPSGMLLYEFQNRMQITRHWQINGTHYQRTAKAWLQNLDDHRQSVLSVLSDTYGPDRAQRWFQRWRIFFMACAQLWAYRNGREWLVSHYKMRPN